MHYLTFNDKTSIFSYVNDRYFSIKLRQLIWIYKDKTYIGWNGIGEGLQWFFNTIADLPGAAMGGGGGVLQYNNGLAQKCITLSSRSVQLDSANTNEINLDKHLVFTLFI